jgi:protein tyrosine/serine phosphatase
MAWGLAGICVYPDNRVPMPFDPTNLNDRRRAMRQLYLADHGVLRTMFKNWRVVAPGMYRSNQPSPGQIARIAKMGIKTILNLRGKTDSGHYHLEREATARHGIDLVDIRVRSRDTPEKATVLALNEAFQRIQYPALMHCKSGADRAGMGAALYLILKENRTATEALEQLSLKYLHVKQGKTGLLDHFFETFIAWAKAHGKPDDRATFLDWVENVYDPAAVKAAFMSSWWANILVDKILRRE